MPDSLVARFLFWVAAWIFQISAGIGMLCDFLTREDHFLFIVEPAEIVDVTLLIFFAFPTIDILFFTISINVR